MLQRTLAFLLIGMLTLHTFSQISIVVAYQLNKEYITTVLCVNKARPQLRCEGKCYLAQKLKAQEEAETQLPALLKKIPEISWFCATPAVQLLFPSGDTSLAAGAVYVVKSYASTLPDIFQPPKV